ncbi:MAG: DUF1080 domain-containing protein [Acidobacteria bacterium]|nr:DUF1080 domain-containing protein [Acidobacteriota bacterium]
MSPAALVLLAASLQTAPPAWQPMFDGKTLDGWKIAGYTNPGEIKAENGTLLLKHGNPLTGVNYTKDFPKTDYEVRFEAMRDQGNDFFASLTFPVGDSFATWVLGGWGGDIVGISSIENWDASENETRVYQSFTNGRWYKFRLKVTAEKIQAWIDDERIINVEIAGRVVSLRPGPIKISTPFGFASYNTTGVLRSIEYRLSR